MTESTWSSDDVTPNPPSRKLRKVLPHDNFDDRGICAAPQLVAPRLDIGGENGLRAVIRVIRKARGLKQQDLARESGISGNYLCFIESGRRDPTVAVLRRLGGALKIPTAMFFVWQEAGDDALEATDIDKIVELLNRRIPMCAPQKSPKKHGRRIDPA